jgi:hypothetical protein
MPCASKVTTYRVLNSISLLVAIGLLIACAEIQEKEQLLSAAGFSMKYADTPEKLEHLKQQEQHKIIPYIKGGKSYFVYADSINCQCMYVGDDTAFQQFNSLQVQHDIANQQRITAEMNQEWEMNGGRWGQPWGNGPWNGYGGNFY